MCYIVSAHKGLKLFCIFAQLDSSLFPQSEDPRNVGEFVGIWPTRKKMNIILATMVLKTKRILNEIFIYHHFHLPKTNSKHMSKINVNVYKLSIF